jgi:L-2-hydroxyglutarate oxidase LhgO
MPDVDALVIGAGVIGLAASRALALTGRSVIVVEKAGRIGSETSSRNSEVIHSGLYYPPGGLKAALCVAGRRALYNFCATRAISHRRCGKLVVAASAAELKGLAALARRGAQNGVEDLQILTKAEAQALEPALHCAGALLVPSTGILDSAAYLLTLRGEAERSGASIAFETPFLRAGVIEGGFEIETGGAEPMRLTASALINCAGLHATSVARAIEGYDPAQAPETRFAKGNYFGLSGRQPFRHLIYPAPQAHGLGVHLTLDLGGQARFGPDVEWVETLDYRVDPARAEKFEAAIRAYWPDLPSNALAPAYAGIRPKISGPEEAAADFRIDGPAAHGVPGLVQLFGIESPGLTASLAIADQIVAALDGAAQEA